MNKQAPTISGEVHPWGYEILDAEGSVIYRAGNCPWDSRGYSPFGLPLATLREYCNKTGEEIAEETGTRYIGHCWFTE